MVRYENKRHLVDYFKKNLVKGYPIDSLRWALINQGYMRVEVMNALEQAKKELAEAAPVLKEKPKITYELYDDYDKPIEIKFPFWKKIKSWFR